MDLHCPKCGEPWEPVEFRFHALWYKERDESISMESVVRKFMTEGCGEAFGWAGCAARCDALAPFSAADVPRIVRLAGSRSVSEEARRALGLPDTFHVEQ
jgi:hypothetical protein